MLPVQTLDHPGHQAATAGTIKAFRVWGVPVRLHFTFILLVVFVCVSVLGSAQSSSTYAIFLLGSLVSVLLHEFGHSLVASRFGIRTTEIVMFPIGGLSRMERPLPPTAERSRPPPFIASVDRAQPASASVIKIHFIVESYEFRARFLRKERRLHRLDLVAQLPGVHGEVVVVGGARKLVQRLGKR